METAGEPLQLGAMRDATHDVMCDACGIQPISGPRYKCVECVNFNLCSKCIMVRDNYRTFLGKLNLKYNYTSHFNVQYRPYYLCVSHMKPDFVLICLQNKRWVNFWYCVRFQDDNHEKHIFFMIHDPSRWEAYLTGNAKKELIIFQFILINK